MMNVFNFSLSHLQLFPRHPKPSHCVAGNKLIRANALNLDEKVQNHGIFFYCDNWFAKIKFGIYTKWNHRNELASSVCVTVSAIYIWTTFAVCFFSSLVFVFVCFTNFLTSYKVTPTQIIPFAYRKSQNGLWHCQCLHRH